MQKSLTTIFWFCDTPSPYNSSLFNALNKDNTLQLCVFYRTVCLDSHPWKTDLLDGYNYKDCSSNILVKCKLLTSPLLNIFKKRDVIYILGSWNNIIVLSLLVILFLFNQPYIIWTDSPNHEKQRGNLFGFLRRIFLTFTFKKAKFVMGTGIPAVDTLVKMGAPSSKTVNFPYFIDTSLYKKTDAFDYANTPQSLFCFKFISIGVLNTKLKGHDIALYAIEKFYKQTNIDFHYTIVGDGPDLEKLKHIASELKISDKVTFTGWLEPKTLIDSHLSKSHILIHPSPIHEPYGVAVLEGMISGLAILTSDKTIAGLDKVISGINGFIHIAGDSSSLCADLVRISRDNTQLCRMSSNSLELMNNHTISIAVSIINKLVNSIHE